jgi:hypothetical protein
MNARASFLRAFRDGLFLQLGFYIGAVAIMVLGLRKLPEIATSERDVFFGVLQVMTLGLLMVLLGMVLQVYLWHQKHQSEGPDDAA